MDHFNATVHNGALVSTRRGLRVSKTKHHGTRFVNTFAAPVSSSPKHRRSHSSRDVSTTPEQKFRFVEKLNERPARRSQSRSRTPKSRSLTPSQPSPRPKEYVFSNDSANNTPPTRTVDFCSDAYIFSSSPDLNSLGQWDSQSQEQELPELGDAFIDMGLGDAAGRSNPEELLGYTLGRSLASYDFNTNAASNAVRSPRSVPHRDILGIDQGYVSDPTSYGNKIWPGGQSLAQSDDIFDMKTIANAAIEALNNGRHEIWRRNMKQIRDMIPQQGGMRPEWGDVLDRIRRWVYLKLNQRMALGATILLRADIEGAAYTGSLPYLTFPKFFASASAVLPQVVKESLTVSMQCVLQMCGMPKVIIDSMEALALFTQASILAQNAAGGSFRANTREYNEEYLWVEHQLLRYPGPLNESPVGFSRSESNSAECYPGGVQNQGPVSYQTTSTHQQQGLNVSSASLLGTPLRMAALLFAEALVGDAFSQPPYHILLTGLANRVRKINVRLNRPTVLFYPDGMPYVALLRPVLIWICVVAYTIADVLEHGTGELVDRSPFEECLGLVAGTTAAGVDNLPESDFDLCRLLPVREMGGYELDGRAVVKNILLAYEQRQLLRPALNHFM